ncbi:MAG: hypothetical protein AAF799_10600 [Myxococcota bacterium]
MGARYRGSQLIAKLRALDEEPESDQILEALPEQTRTMMRGVGRGEWLPVSVDIDLNTAMWDVLGEVGIRRVCARSILDSLNGPLLGPLAQGTIRLFGVSPRHFFKMVPRGWSQVYRNAGSASFDDCELGRSVRLSYEELPPEFFARGYLEGIAGGLEGLLRFCELPGESIIRMRDPSGGRLHVDVSWAERA